MRLFSFGRGSGRPLNSWVDGKGVQHRVDPKTSKTVISPIFSSGEGSRVACFYMEQGGFVPRHPAGSGQLFALVGGEGWVSGEDGRRIPIQKGQAAFWAPGELHEAGTAEGMTVIVIEGVAADPAGSMRELRS